MHPKMLKAVVRGISSTARPIRNITVIGAGIFGSGIAQVAAEANQKVVLVDLNHEILKKSKKKIENQLKMTSTIQMKRYIDIEDEESYDKGVKNYFSRAMKNIRFSDDIASSVKNCDLAIEAVPDEFDKKVSLLMHIDKLAPEHSILATTSSAFSIQETGAKIKRRQKYCGIIFFLPPPFSKLFEVVRGKLTSDVTVQRIQEWGHELGQASTVCYDNPGLVANYLTIFQAAEAIRILERGEATFEDIDKGLKLVPGYNYGPFELIDILGIDYFNEVLSSWHKQRPWTDLFKPTTTISKLVAEGKLGVKTGEGFYKYDEKGCRRT